MNESGRHPVNVGQLVMGLAFLGLVVLWLLVVSDAVQGAELRWLMPMPWILAGAIGLLASIVAGRRRAASAAEPPDTWATDTQATTHPTEEIR